MADPESAPRPHTTKLVTETHALLSDVIPALQRTVELVNGSGPLDDRFAEARDDATKLLTRCRTLGDQCGQHEQKLSRRILGVELPPEGQDSALGTPRDGTGDGTGDGIDDMRAILLQHPSLSPPNVASL